jgi:catechol 2,3-dioxygenase-like lactoylglutathione lyase family enzyme
VRVLRGLILGETWALPAGVALLAVLAIAVDEAGASWWPRAAGPLLLAATVLLVLVSTSSSASTSRRSATPREEGQRMDWKLELVAVPVSDVDRAKAFYADQLGFNADHDHQVNDQIRFVQLTPPGSGCSIALGTGVIDTPPGSVKGLQLVVDDIEAAHAQLRERSVEVSDVQDFPWGRFVFFNDPDGNGWAVQQIVYPEGAEAPGG